MHFEKQYLIQMTWLSKVSALPLGKNNKHLDEAFINQFSFSFFLLKILKMLYLPPGTTRQNSSITQKNVNGMFCSL